jgi:hypothetical protein
MTEPTCLWNLLHECQGCITASENEDQGRGVLGPNIQPTAQTGQL